MKIVTIGADTFYALRARPQVVPDEQYPTIFARTFMAAESRVFHA
jgi:hypothetical protein